MHDRLARLGDRAYVVTWSDRDSAQGGTAHLLKPLPGIALKDDGAP